MPTSHIHGPGLSRELQSVCWFPALHSVRLLPEERGDGCAVMALSKFFALQQLPVQMTMHAHTDIVFLAFRQSSMCGLHVALK